MAGIYADEAITGTKTDKRIDFKRLITDCIQGEIDLVMTKSISRFARNTLDTLKYVRKLKEDNVAVFFEEENINTLTMDGELLLTILSFVAQQEVENISANVKKGLKMQCGELIGFQGCLGYDYDTKTKSISVNEKEAEIVCYIFKHYLEGNLVELRLSESISLEVYQEKYHEVAIRKEKLLAEKRAMEVNLSDENALKKRLEEFKRILEKHQYLESFDRVVFESIADKIIVGGINEAGEHDPAMITILYKTGLKDNQEGKRFKSRRKNAREETESVETKMCSCSKDEARKSCLYPTAIHAGTAHLSL